VIWTLPRSSISKSINNCHLACLCNIMQLLILECFDVVDGSNSDEFSIKYWIFKNFFDFCALMDCFRRINSLCKYLKVKSRILEYIGDSKTLQWCICMAWSTWKQQLLTNPIQLAFIQYLSPNRYKKLQKAWQWSSKHKWLLCDLFWCFLMSYCKFTNWVCWKVISLFFSHKSLKNRGVYTLPIK